MLKKLSYMLVFVALILSGVICAQVDFDGPESIAFDAPRNRYLVSNYHSGEVLDMDTLGGIAPYFDDAIHCYGNWVDNDTMYLTLNETKLLALDLTSNPPDTLFDLYLTPLNHLDGVCTDTSGNIYVVDTGGRILKVSKSTLVPQLLASGLPISSQDCVHDPFHNRLLVCSYSAANAVRAVDLTTGVVTILAPSGTAYLDGICMDDRGNTYVASHAGVGYIHMFDSTFSGPPVVISSGHDGPAGLCYNVRDKMIVAPNFNDNTVSFVRDPYYLDDDADDVINGLDNCPLHYNPAQEDVDADGVGDSCDVCPSVFDPDQPDADSDGAGDSCDICPGYDDFADRDSDAVPDSCDNCPYSFNPGQEDTNLNGVGDACDFMCGDADGSKAVDIDDVVYLVSFIFAGGPPPEPAASGDADCSGGVDIDDAVYLIGYVFSGGPSPCDPDGDGEPDC